MKIQITLGARSTLRDSRYFALAVRAVMEGVIEANRIFLRHHAVPPMYSLGLKYQSEPPGTTEEFADIPTVLSRGWGDCDDLVAFRIAQLRHEGEHATPRVSWRPAANGRPRLFHVLVRRADGTIEDPSALLGMYQELDRDAHRQRVNGRRRAAR